jgi:hypothetical protein
MRTTRDVEFDLFYLMKHKALCDMSIVERSLRGLLRKKLGRKRMTLAEFSRATGKRMTIVHCDILAGKAIYTTPVTAPDMDVVRAVTDSMRIPIVFKGSLWEGGRVIYDGGMVDNLALTRVPVADAPFTCVLNMKRQDTSTIDMNNPRDVFARAMYVSTAHASEARWSEHEKHFARCFINADVPYICTFNLSPSEESICQTLRLGRAIGDGFADLMRGVDVRPRPPRRLPHTYCMTFSQVKHTWEVPSQHCVVTIPHDHVTDVQMARTVDSTITDAEWDAMNIDGDGETGFTRLSAHHIQLPYLHKHRSVRVMLSFPTRLDTTALYTSCMFIVNCIP